MTSLEAAQRADQRGTRRVSHLLSEVFSGLDRASVRWCVLREYEGFPNALLGRDVDILIHPDDLLCAIQVVYGISNVTVTRVVPRNGGVSLCADSVQLDFIWSLTWQGQPYLEVDHVLARSTKWPRWKQLRVPDEADKAIISLFHGYIATGGIKEQYRDEISAVFDVRRRQVIARLSPRTSVKLAIQLVSRIAASDYNGAISSLKSMHWRLFLRSLARSPGSSLLGQWTHYWQRIRNLVAPGKVITVAFVGVDGTGKSTVVAEVKKTLLPIVCKIEHRYFRPKVFYDRAPQKVGNYLHPHSLAPHSNFGSALRAMIWCAENWAGSFLASRNGTVLELYDRYFHDLLVDPRRYRYGGPRWLVRLLSALVVPDLFVLLDAPPEVSRARKPEFDVAETTRLRVGYLMAVPRRRSVLIVDATQPLEQVVTQVEAAILHLLEQRAADTFAQHFNGRAQFLFDGAAAHTTSGLTGASASLPTKSPAG